MDRLFGDNGVINVDFVNIDIFVDPFESADLALVVVGACDTWARILIESARVKYEVCLINGT